jgi:SAM-dependent methyltransferase
VTNRSSVSSADPLYASGRYFADPSRHAGDAAFKAATFLGLLRRAIDLKSCAVHSYADVGSGSGDAARLVAKGLREAGSPLVTAKGYDVSPHIRNLKSADGVDFVNADFANDGEPVDLVTLFDVIEHVPDPSDFLKRIARRCRIVGLHIPLDDSVNAAFRDLFKYKVKDPGHITFMDGVSALNLLAGAGLRVLDYQYTMGFEAPSGRSSLASKAAIPLRRLIARISPWLLSKTLGGASLMVVALTADGVRYMQECES